MFYDFLVTQAISVLVMLLTAYLPNDPGQTNKWKKAVLKVFKAIAQVYGNDPDFKAAMPK